MKAVEAAVRSKASPVFVITGHDAENLEEHLENIDINILRNHDYASGVNTSIRLGLKSVPSSCDGALLIPAGLLMGAHPVGVHLKGLLILAALVAVSAVGFSFYNQLLRYHPVGQIAIYNAFIPVLGVVLSCLLLGEPFSWRYLLSGALVTVGICAVNLPGKGKN